MCRIFAMVRISVNIPAGNQDKAKPFGGQLFRKNNPFIKNYDKSNKNFMRKYK